MDPSLCRLLSSQISIPEGSYRGDPLATYFELLRIRSHRLSAAVQGTLPFVLHRLVLISWLPKGSRAVGTKACGVGSEITRFDVIDVV